MLWVDQHFLIKKTAHTQLPQRNRMHFYSIKPLYLKNERKILFCRTQQIVTINLFSQTQATHWKSSGHYMMASSRLSSPFFSINVRLKQKKPSILIKLLADQQWRCSFVWNIQKKVIWDSAQSEIDCLIEWYSMGSFSHFLYICLVRDKKKPIILCLQYYGNDEHWLQRLFGTIHRIQPILELNKKKTPSMTQHGVNGWILLYSALSTIRNNFLVCICFALWFHCVMCTW